VLGKLQAWLELTVLSFPRQEVTIDGDQQLLSAFYKWEKAQLDITKGHRRGLRAPRNNNDVRTDPSSNVSETNNEDIASADNGIPWNTTNTISSDGGNLEVVAVADKFEDLEISYKVLYIGETSHKRKRTRTSAI
jgi:hypothetical protein